MPCSDTRSSPSLRNRLAVFDSSSGSGQRLGGLVEQRGHVDPSTPEKQPLLIPRLPLTSHPKTITCQHLSSHTSRVRGTRIQPPPRKGGTPRERMMDCGERVCESFPGCRARVRAFVGQALTGPRAKGQAQSLSQSQASPRASAITDGCGNDRAGRVTRSTVPQFEPQLRQPLLFLNEPSPPGSVHIHVSKRKYLGWKMDC